MHRPRTARVVRGPVYESPAPAGGAVHLRGRRSSPAQVELGRRARHPTPVSRRRHAAGDVCWAPMPPRLQANASAVVSVDGPDRREAAATTPDGGTTRG